MTMPGAAAPATVAGGAVTPAGVAGGGGGVPGPATPPAAGFSAALAARLGDSGVTRPGVAAPPWVRVTLGEMIGGGAVPVAPPGAGVTPVGGLAAVTTGGSPGAAVLDAAGAYLGVPYRWGGTDPATGLDCSGFVQRVFADLGVGVPRVSKDQSRAGTAVASLAEAHPGDLVYWEGKGGRPNHIGIYLGGGRMVHAPRTGDVVREAPVRSAPPDAIRRIL